MFFCGAISIGRVNKIYAGVQHQIEHRLRLLICHLTLWHPSSVSNASQLKRPISQMSDLDTCPTQNTHRKFESQFLIPPEYSFPVSSKTSGIRIHLVTPMRFV